MVSSNDEILEKARSVLLKSISEDNISKFQKIVVSGFPIDWSITTGGRTSLMHCASYGSREMLEQILALGAEINTRDMVGRSALHYAASAGRAKNLKFLLKQEGVEIDLMTFGGTTPLMMAVESGNKKAVLQCLNKGCNPFAQNGLGQTAKTFAEKFSFEGDDDTI